MQSHHRLVAIGAVLSFAFLVLCVAINGRGADITDVMIVLLVGIPLAWLDIIGKGIKWFLEYLDN